MTCCADDTTFLGYVQKRICAEIKSRAMGEDPAKVEYAKLAMYHGTGPVLEAEHIESGDEIKELVYFN